MRQHTQRVHSAAMVSGQTIGTEAHYRASVQSIETARVTTAQYIEYFKSSGATSATEVGKAAVAHARKFDPALPNLSPTSLHKQERAGSLSPALALAARWIWSIETRARQLSAKDKAVGAPAAGAPAAGAPAAGAPAAGEPAKANKAKGKNLPSTTGNTLPVERVALLAVMDLLARGIDNESWQEIADARKMLGGLLS